jgi:hypothetical protein
MSKLRLTALTAAACLVAAVAPAAHASSLAFTGIRPGTLLLFIRHGARVYDTTISGCTASYVFQTTGNAFDPSQQLYLGTAGHCASVGDNVDAAYVPPGGGGTVTTHIGTVVFDGNPTDLLTDSNDFALIAIDPSLNGIVSPSMAYWGGPTGVYTGSSSVVTWTGNAGFVGGTVPRVGQLVRNDDLIAVNPTVAAEGDSGSAVNTIDGLAAGSLVAVTTMTTEFNAGTRAWGPSIASMLALAGHPLATCASAKPWPLPGCPPL